MKIIIYRQSYFLLHVNACLMSLQVDFKKAQKTCFQLSLCFSPVVLDMDGRIYARPWQGGLLSGGFEKNPKPIFTEGRNQLEIQSMQEDWDHFGNEAKIINCGQKSVFNAWRTE